jgi:hypothetical protein
MADENSRGTVSDLCRQTLGLDALEALAVNATCAASPAQQAAQLLATLPSPLSEAEHTAQLAQPDTRVASEPEPSSGGAHASLNRPVTARVTFQTPAQAEGTGTCERDVGAR